MIGQSRDVQWASAGWGKRKRTIRKRKGWKPILCSTHFVMLFWLWEQTGPHDCPLSLNGDMSCESGTTALRIRSFRLTKATLPSVRRGKSSQATELNTGTRMRARMKLLSVHVQELNPTESVPHGSNSHPSVFRSQVGPNALFPSCSGGNKIPLKHVPSFSSFAVLMLYSPGIFTWWFAPEPFN